MSHQFFSLYFSLFQYFLFSATIIQSIGIASQYIMLLNLKQRKIISRLYFTPHYFHCYFFICYLFILESIYCLCFITNNIHKDMLRPYYWDDDVIPIFAIFDLHIYLDKLMKLIVILSLLLLLLFVVPYLVRFIYYNDLLFKIIFWIRLVCIGIFFFFMSSKMSYRIG